jgi:hypothetical protein
MGTPLGLITSQVHDAIKNLITFSYVDRFTPFPWRIARMVSRRTPVASLI